MAKAVGSRCGGDFVTQEFDLQGQPCPACGSVEPPIYVHSHTQCTTCKTNIDPCCGGASTEIVDVYGRSVEL